MSREGRCGATVTPPRRQELAGRTLAVLNRGNRRNPDVLMVASEAGAVVVKDFAPRGWWVRHLLGPWLHAREIRAYRALADHPAVPRFLGRIDAQAFAVEYRPGQRLGRRLAPTLPPAFLEELEEALAGMHERGVVHLDLRHRSNVLVDEGGHPVLIDFASALCLRPDGLPGRLLLPGLAWLDRRALAKWQRKLAPQGRRSPAAAGGASAARRGASRPTK